jgi:hypothetical protein
MKIRTFLTLGLLLTCMTVAGIPPAVAGEPFAPTVLGTPVGEWGVEAMKAFAGASYSQLPDCGAKSQRGPVWFLYIGSPSGTNYAKDCTISSNMHLMFFAPNIFWIQTADDDPSLTEMDWRQIINSADVWAWLWPDTRVVVELDGKSVELNPGTPVTKMQTPVFKAKWNSDNPWGGYYDVSQLNAWPIVADGYFVMLPPLSRGQHVLRISPNAETEFTYNLTVR